MGKLLSRTRTFLQKKYTWILFAVIFAVFLFSRIYLLEDRSGFGWDQTTIAWAVKHLLVDHQIQLIGMQAKLNTGFYIGPLYYYYAAIFFWATNLDPIASLFITIATAIINFLVIFFIVRKLWSTQVAIVAICLQTVSMFLLNSDHSQWPVTFIPTISLLIFYTLYKAIVASPKYILLLFTLIGLSFHIHFTSVFFLIYVFLSLPLWKWNKQTVLYILAGMGIMLIFLLPNIIFAFQTQNASGSHLVSYIHTTLRMFHGRRFLQLTHDALIQFDLILSLSSISRFVFLIPLAFIGTYYVVKKSRETFVLSYLTVLWILVPWVAFTLYTGELTDYYFSVTRPIAIFCLSFLTVWVWQRKLFVWKVLLIAFWAYFVYTQSVRFFQPQHGSFDDAKQRALQAMQAGQTIDYAEGVPEAYFYYAYMREKKK